MSMSLVQKTTQIMSSINFLVATLSLKSDNSSSKNQLCSHGVKNGV